MAHYHYRYASGREGIWCWIGLAGQKRYIFCIFALSQKGRYLAEGFQTEFQKPRLRKSCIRCKTSKILTIKALKGSLLQKAGLGRKKK